MSKSSNELSLGYAIGKTNWYLKTLINKLLREEECSITNEQWLVLKVVDSNPGMSQTEVAERSQKEKTNITRIIDLLEKSGCVERRKDKRDRRYYRIYATGEGKKVLKMVSPITEKTEEICTQSLSRKQIGEMIALLDTVCDNVKKEL